MADIETIDTINCDVNCLYSNPPDMARLIDTSIETRGKKITYDRVTFKKASQKRQFPKHKDRKQNTKKKKLGKNNFKNCLKIEDLTQIMTLFLKKFGILILQKTGQKLEEKLAMLIQKHCVKVFFILQAGKSYYK